MRRSVRVFALFGWSLVSTALPALAFDTGPHWALTREAMLVNGCGPTAVSVAQVENWLVDYFSEQPIAGLKSQLKPAHFDNLTNATAVRNYWDGLTINTQKAVAAAARANDAEQIVVLTGMSLHAVQDFYTHSNWVELHPATPDVRSVQSGIGALSDDVGAFQSATWFDTPAAQLEALAVRTGTYPASSPPAPTDHGDQSYGMNHDSRVRPRFDQAYVFAYFASVQWVEAVKQWAEAANPGIWNRVAGLSLSTADANALTLDQVATYRISEYLGHWNGPGSAAADMIGSITWMNAPDSRFVKHFKVDGWHRALFSGLDSPSAATVAVPAVPNNPSRGIKVVTVRTMKVGELPTDTFESRIDTGADPDFYALVTIDGLRFTEPMQLNQKSLTDVWRTMRFVSAARPSVPVHYELWDEDGGLAGDDDICDVHPAVNVKAYDTSPAIAVGTTARVSTGGARPDKDRALITLLINTRATLPAGSPGPEPTPPPTPSSNGLLINRAVYGDLPNGKFVDVTAIVADRAKGGTLEIQATNGNFGDPAPGIVKSLRVDYTRNGTAGTVSVQESQTLSIDAVDMGARQKAIDLRVVQFRNPDNSVTGTFTSMGGGRWVEQNTSGTFNFTETQRDEWSVYLVDPSRNNVTVQLDVWTNRIFLNWDKPDRAEIYQITNASR